MTTAERRGVLWRILLGGLVVMAGSIGILWSINAHNDIAQLATTVVAGLGALLALSAARRVKK